MSEPCGICLGGPNCVPLNDINLMSLDSTVYPFVLECPPGYNCMGTLINGGTISFPVCNQVLTASLPPGATAAQWQAVIGQLLAQAMQLAATCGPPPPPPPPGGSVILYFNDPECCTFGCPDNLPFRECVAPGLVVALSQQLADATALNLACTLASTYRICLSDLPVKEFCGGTSMNALISVSTGSGIFNVFTWQIVAGALPPGVTFNASGTTGNQVAITGTPTAGGVYSFYVRVTSSRGDYQQKQYTITILNIDTASPLPNGTSGKPYSQALSQTGAVTPITWSIASGSLPPGLTINASTGTISGTPTTPGTYNFTIGIVDSSS